MFAVNTCSLRLQQFHRQMRYHDRALSCIDSLNCANIEESAKQQNMMDVAFQPYLATKRNWGISFKVSTQDVNIVACFP